MVFLLIIAAFFYFLPAIVANSRGHRNGSAITVLNLFLGWTFLGWVAALVWACTAVNPNLSEGRKAVQEQPAILPPPIPRAPREEPRKDFVSAPAIGVLLILAVIVGGVGYLGQRSAKSGPVWTEVPSSRIPIESQSPDSLSPSPNLETAAISQPATYAIPLAKGRSNVQFAHRFACRDQSQLRILLNLYDPDRPQRWVGPLAGAIDAGTCSYIKDARGLEVLERAEPRIARVRDASGLHQGEWWTAAEVVK